jgi:hypothetical protein
MSETVQANDGAMLPLSSLATQITYAGGFVSTLQVIYQSNTYTQTFLNDGTDIIYISGWVNAAYPQTQQVMTDESGDIMEDESGNIMVTE